jgi:hypothetical protein
MASSTAVGDEFADAGWALDDLVDEAVDDIVRASHAADIHATLNSLRTLPGRLGI